MNSVVMELALQRALCVSRFLVTKQASSRASRAPTGLRCLVRLRISQGVVELQSPTPRCNKTRTWRVLFCFVFGGPQSVVFYTLEPDKT
jgi:hypothetical protein